MKTEGTLKDGAKLSSRQRATTLGWYGPCHETKIRDLSREQLEVAAFEMYKTIQFSDRQIEIAYNALVRSMP